MCGDVGGLGIGCGSDHLEEADAVPEGVEKEVELLPEERVPDNRYLPRESTGYEPLELATPHRPSAPDIPLLSSLQVSTRRG